jgi:hypothetical protein
MGIPMSAAATGPAMAVAKTIPKTRRIVPSKYYRQLGGYLQQS